MKIRENKKRKKKLTGDKTKAGLHEKKTYFADS